MFQFKFNSSKEPLSDRLASLDWAVKQIPVDICSQLPHKYSSQTILHIAYELCVAQAAAINSGS